MITALCDRPRPDAASALSSCGNAKPPIPSAPILMKLRREIPSQYRREEALLAKTVSITKDSDEAGCECNHENCCPRINAADFIGSCPPLSGAENLRLQGPTIDITNADFVNIAIEVPDVQGPR